MSCSTDRTKDTAHDFEKGETKKINKFRNKLGRRKAPRLASWAEVAALVVADAPRRQCQGADQT